MPEGRPYSLGNSSADLASIQATSEMSASSHARSHGRMPENQRAVSYDQDGRQTNIVAPASAYATDGAEEAREILTGRGLY